MEGKGWTVRAMTVSHYEPLSSVVKVSPNPGSRGEQPWTCNGFKIKMYCSYALH